jgi:plastocyanin
MKKAAVAIALILASLALVACGSSDDDSTESAPDNGAAVENENSGGESGGNEESESGGGATVSFEAAPSGLAYSSDSATAEAGEVTVDFNNPQPIGHDVAIESSGGEMVGKTEIVTESSSNTVVNLKPGKYTFYCSVPGHREAGMEGTLTVK